MTKPRRPAYRAWRQCLRRNSPVAAGDRPVSQTYASRRLPSAARDNNCNARVRSDMFPIENMPADGESVQHPALS